jgi:hypothetical protein
MTGTKPELLASEPEMPPLFEHIWRWFLRLTARRGGGYGLAPLSFQEIAAWSGLTRLEPTPWEVEQLEKLDDLYLKISNEKMKKDDHGGRAGKT